VSTNMYSPFDSMSDRRSQPAHELQSGDHALIARVMGTGTML
jgi:hypothetical protein